MPLSRIKKKLAIHEQVETGALGGVPPRISPTTILSSVFSSLNKGNPPAIGISTRIADRPVGARVLGSADYHTNVLTGSGFVGLKKIAGVGNSAVDKAVHVISQNVHPTLLKKIRQGE